MLDTTDMHIAFCMKIDVYWHVSWTSRYDTSRSFERNPMKRMSRNKLACKLMRFVAAKIGVEHESGLIVILEQDRTDRGLTIG